PSLVARSRSQLFGDRRLARKFVERVDVKILLIGNGRDHQDPLAVRTDRLIAHVHADRRQTQAPPYLFKDDLHGLHARSSAFGAWRRRWRRLRGWRWHSVGRFACRLRAGRLVLRSRDGRDGLRRLLFEKITELIFSEFRRARDQINARELIALGALTCVEQ